MVYWPCMITQVIHTWGIQPPNLTLRGTQGPTEGQQPNANGRQPLTMSGATVFLGVNS